MIDNRYCVLVVDDEPAILDNLAGHLKPTYCVYTAASADEARNILIQQAQNQSPLDHHPIDIILADKRMPLKQEGIELLEWVHGQYPGIVKLLMTGHADEEIINAINRGHIYYYLEKPYRIAELLHFLRNIEEVVESRILLQQRHQELERHVSERTRELNQRTRELEEANNLLQQRTRELEQRTRELERLVLIDPLTSLFNRRAMDGLVQAELRRHARYDSPFSLGIVDIDHFKHVNTRFTLPGGDQILIGVSRLLLSSLREVDSVGRIGGEEFLILARETDENGANSLAERIRSRIEASPIDYRGTQVRITVSIGVAVAESRVPVEYTQMYNVAAEALNQAKASGRNRCIIRRSVQPRYLRLCPDSL